MVVKAMLTIPAESVDINVPLAVTEKIIHLREILGGRIVINKAVILKFFQDLHFVIVSFLGNIPNIFIEFYRRKKFA